jgi:hypothetical protein
MVYFSTFILIPYYSVFFSKLLRYYLPDMNYITHIDKNDLRLHCIHKHPFDLKCILRIGTICYIIKHSYEVAHVACRET